VTIHDPNTTMIDADVEIGQDTVLYPHVALEGQTSLGRECVVRSHVRIANSQIGDRVAVQDCCVIEGSRLEDDATVGPFAHLRTGAVLRRTAKVGNFVEIKKADLGEGSKANHLSYVGDAKIGKRVNIGAGTITCNYDGERKHETVIEDDVFIGSDSQLVAPVRVGRGALVAAGTTVANDVPPGALAIARTPQVNRPGWAARRRALPQPAAVRAASARHEQQGARHEARGTRQDGHGTESPAGAKMQGKSSRAANPAPRAQAPESRRKEKHR